MITPKQSFEIFGTAPDGKSVYRIPLTGGGLTANIITWGASLQSLYLEGHEPSLVLGFNSLSDYLQHGLYFGASVGRYANRIAKGRFEVDGVSYQTDRNYLGKHTLHGGTDGSGSQNWTIIDAGTSHVDLMLESPAGEMGFPGAVEIICSYTLKDDGVLRVSYTTKCDAPTIANVTHHSYFTLDGSGDIRDHILQIHADNYLPVDDELIPTGAPAPVEGTPFDFTTPSAIRTGTDAGTIYDHNFCLGEAQRNIQTVAQARSTASGVSMVLATTEPGVQFYAAHKLSIPVAGIHDAPYGNFAGFCLEPQNWPDAPNHVNFPSALVTPENELRQTSEFQFLKNR